MDALDAFSGSYSAQLSQKALEKRLPLSGTFELLPYCNMRCSMCYIVHDRPADWKDSLHSVDFWDALLDQAIEQEMLYGLITGGEPLLYPCFRELMERINKKTHSSGPEQQRHPAEPGDGTVAGYGVPRAAEHQSIRRQQ